MGVHLNCGVYIEELSCIHGPIRRTIQLAKARVSLVKSEDSCVIIRVKAYSKPCKSLGYKVIEPKFFTKFIHEGKSTIALNSTPVNIMLRDCPPDSLKMFLYNVKSLWNQCKKVRIGRLHDKDPSLSLLDEVTPLPFPSVRSCPHLPVTKSFPKIDLSPIARKRRLTSLQCPESRLYSSTPVRVSPRTGEPEIRSPSICFRVDNDRTFSHVLSDWQCNVDRGTTEQSRVIDQVKMGLNVFCTGGAGTGKSYLLNKLLGILPPSETAVMASTGVAASLIKGTTVHSFSGVGQILDAEDLEDISSSWLESVKKRIITDPRIITRWKGVRRIVIDEVSMLSSRVFTRLEAIARIALGKCSEKVAFGGIQVIVFGDFFQLPPVSDFPSAYMTKKKFAFQSPAWRACRFCTIELRTSWRQSDDTKFSRLLNQIREGNSPRWVLDALRSRICNQIDYSKPSVLTTRLCTHRRDADQFNERLLNSLPGTVRIFKRKDVCPQNFVIHSLSTIPEKIQLKVGAQVMLLRNLDVSRGLVNGVRGVVEKFLPLSEGGFPVVRFVSMARSHTETSLVVYPERWTVNAWPGATGTEEQVTRLQLPLCLAWAISIHKSQGLTLENVDVDLSKTFEHGQAYVALSRCCSLQGLRLFSWQNDFIRVDRRVTQFYRTIREKSKLKAK